MAFLACRSRAACWTAAFAPTRIARNHRTAAFVPVQDTSILSLAFSRRRFHSSSSTKEDDMASKNGSFPDNENVDEWVTVPTHESLEEMERDLCKLNGGRVLNVNSRQQVSQAIHGFPNGKVDKATLKKKLDEGHEQHLLIRKILELKDAQRRVGKKNNNQSEIRRRNSGISLEEGNLQRSFSTEVQDEEQFVSPQQPEDYEEDVVDDDSEIMEEFDSPYADSVRKLFASDNCQIPSVWRKHLLDVTRPGAQALVRQLTGANPLGFDKDWRHGVETSSEIDAADDSALKKSENNGKKGPPTLLKFKAWKQERPKCIILARVGEFYETFGVDAIMLVEHCGLNPMGGLAKAGCPIQNIQITLDQLISEGFSAAVYEESGTGNPKIRRFQQIVSPAYPIYLYDMTMKDGHQQEWEYVPRPYVGLLHLASGYVLVEVRVDDQTVRVYERFTDKAVTCHLAAHPPADPVWYVPTQREHSSAGKAPSFLREYKTPNGDKRPFSIRFMNPTLLPVLKPGQSEAERACKIVLSRVLEESDFDGLTADHFTIVENPQNEKGTNALQVETATQLGLLANKAIPSLLHRVLPVKAPAATRDMVQRWLLTPPPPDVSRSIANMVKFVQQPDVGALPHLTVPTIGRILTMLRAAQAGPNVFSEICKSLSATCELLPLLDDDIVRSLLIVAKYESGISEDSKVLSESCKEAAELISSVVAQEALDSNSDLDLISQCDSIPSRFLSDNEGRWRRKVRRESVLEAYENVEKTVRALEKAIFEAEDFFDSKPPLKSAKKNFCHLLHDNALVLKHVPNGASEKNFIERKCKKGTYWTTERVREAESAYIRACKEAGNEVENALVDLSKTLESRGYIRTISLACHINLIFSIVHYHARRANELGWQTAVVNDEDGDREYRLSLEKVWPYWMGKQESVPNTVELAGMWVLTAPNMSGKSTLMRSTAAAALLAVCGFCAPIGAGSRLDRFDNLFVRGASADVPSEGKSAFGAEMEDVSCILRDGGSRSLVFVDELGRGTSPRDGSSLASAILEDMTSKRMSGVFATHLHSILDLPLKNKNRMSYKQMAVQTSSGSNGSLPLVKWTYLLKDGVCRDSMALASAAYYGVSASVLDRAKELAQVLAPSQVPELFGFQQDLGTDDQNENFSHQERILALAGDITGIEKHEFVPPKYSPPVHLHRKSCLYILEIPSADRGPIHYVGETDNIQKRIDSHRKNVHPNISCFIFEASDKSNARGWETLLIRACAQADIPLTSISDGLKSLPVPERL